MVRNPCWPAAPQRPRHTGRWTTTYGFDLTRTRRRRWVCADQELNLRILVVEDEAAIADAIRGGLAADGHAVDVVADGAVALEFADAYPYELVILDVILPGLNGFAVCAALRDRGFNEPVLMLTALDAVSDRVSGLDSGADDYLAKPFAMAELRARVRALRRRRVDDRAPRISIGDLELDPATHGVRRGGHQIRLTAREFALLEFLASHAGQIFGQDRLIEALWDADFASESNIVEVYIRSLRRKIDDGRRNGLIETVRGSGYRLRSDPPGSAETGVAANSTVDGNVHSDEAPD